LALGLDFGSDCALSCEVSSLVAGGGMTTIADAPSRAKGYGPDENSSDHSRFSNSFSCMMYDAWCMMYDVWYMMYDNI